MAGLALALICCVVAGVAAGVWFKVKTDRLARSRAHTEITQFVEHFSKAGIPVDVSTAVYQYLINLPWMHRLPADPKDRLLDVYRVAGEELMDAYENILAVIERELPDRRRDDALVVENVGELVKFIADRPLRDNSRGRVSDLRSCTLTIRLVNRRAKRRIMRVIGLFAQAYMDRHQIVGALGELGS